MLNAIDTFNFINIISIISSLYSFVQEAVRNSEGKSSATEPFVFQTEITGRDKDHVRNLSHILCQFITWHSGRTCPRWKEEFWLVFLSGPNFAISTVKICGLRINFCEMLFIFISLHKINSFCLVQIFLPSCLEDIFCWMFTKATWGKWVNEYMSHASLPRMDRDDTSIYQQIMKGLRWPNTVLARAFAHVIQRAHKDCKN